MTRCLPALLLSTALSSLATGQSLKPTSTDMNLSAFSVPPYPPQVVSLGLQTGGGLRFQTLMPIAGRLAATTDEAKLRGAEAPPSGLYLFTGQANTPAASEPVQGTVFSPPNPRVKLAPDIPADWAVWGTRAQDGPLRLPFGGGYDRLATQLPPTRRVAQVTLPINEQGVYPRYQTLVRAVDPVSGRLLSRVEETAPQQAANQQKMAQYRAVGSTNPDQGGQVIAITAAPNPRFEGLATHLVAGDKNASARQVHLLTFDTEGNLLADLPVSFPYNRSLTLRLPVHNETGLVVGTMSIFGDGPGKKDARDPQDNRFSVIVTDEQGQLWSQFEWTANGTSNRAAIPRYARRQGDKLLLYSTNQQKLLKPVDESWQFNKAGQATLLGTLPYDELPNRSKEVGLVNSGERVGWYNYANGQLLDAFTDAGGESWLLLQRYAEVPRPSGSGLSGMNNRPLTESSPKVYSDLFVLHFDADLKLKQQTVVGMASSPQPVRFSRSVRAEGANYVFGDAANTYLRLGAGNAAPVVERLTPADAAPATPVGVDNFVFDEGSGKLYLLYGLPKLPGRGRVLTVSLP